MKLAVSLLGQQQRILAAPSGKIFQGGTTSLFGQGRSNFDFLVGQMGPIMTGNANSGSAEFGFSGRRGNGLPVQVL